MGEIVLRAGFADLMYRALSRWVDFIPGGLMHTNIASCAVFAACAGSSIATAATVSRVALPSFRAQGYQERLVVGSLAAGGTLGILIPPSILLVLYGLTVGESIGRLFLAGFIPGILLAGVFMLMIGIASVIWPAIAPRQSRSGFWTWQGWTERLLFTLLMVPVLALIFIVLGSIYLGWATPSEAAGFGVSGAMALALLYNFARLFAGNIAGFLLNAGIAAPRLPRSPRRPARLASPTSLRRRTLPQLLPLYGHNDPGSLRIRRPFLGNDNVHLDGGIHLAVRFRLPAYIGDNGRMGRRL